MRVQTSFVAALALGISSFFVASAANAGASQKDSWITGFMAARQMQVQQYLLGTSGKNLSEPIVRPSVVGGGVADAHKWPFQVALVIKSIANNYTAQFCGGVLVAPKYVVTVAHCVDFLNANQLQVLTGTQDLATGGVRRNVAAITIHPDYDPQTFDSDIAVIKMATGDFTSTTGVIIGPQQEQSFGNPGRGAWIMGWGDTDPDDDDFTCCYPTKLHNVYTTIQPNGDCNDADSHTGKITENMICAGEDTGGKAACLADAGGPLVVRNLNGAVRFVAGLAAASGNYTCGAPEKFTVFTRSSKFQAWVNGITSVP